MSKCLFCGEDFSPKSWNQKYCSQKCAKSVVVRCAQCGKKIIRRKRKDGIYFCCRHCSEVYNGRSVKTNCEYCGKEFSAKVSSLIYGYGKYCSKDCHNRSMQIKNFEKCPQCGKEFLTGNNKINKRKYCSKTCMKEAFSVPIEKDILQELYVEQDLTSREVGQVIKRSKKVVLDYLKKYDISIKPDGIQKHAKILCKDGHLVRSHYEKAFDNYLFKLGIEHEYEVRLPFNKRCACDFKIGEVYVEIWGLMTWKTYREGRERKLKLYRDNNCLLLEIFPEDFKNLELKMNELQRLISR
ncbi:TPA: hypothetical protein QFD63_001873 [Enterococcus faecium]|uniref:hypothetical protein n=1 Tax=Enterococcus faecium TaxID=1352 RepID=UPI0011E6E971|nr:hypothetical protein [Enterococcus faecium]MDW7852929.1 hypothetical protein [Enterococcus faecium]TYQ95117.1 hypothetical protein BEK92_05920 [Enterococcus faecium]TYQ96686.1 hypothetical protein BEK91_00155 [Enterococcus faecium]